MGPTTPTGIHTGEHLERAVALLAPGWGNDRGAAQMVDCDLAARARAELSRRVTAAARAAEALIIEAATIQRGDHTALLLGPSGSGKTTLALRARESGWRIVGDEACWLGHDGVWAIGVRGQSRTALRGAVPFGDRWLFDTTRPALQRIGWPQTVMVLTAGDLTTTRDRLSVLADASSDPARLGRAGVERLYRLTQHAAWSRPATDRSASRSTADPIHITG